MIFRKAVGSFGCEIREPLTWGGEVDPKTIPENRDEVIFYRFWAGDNERGASVMDDADGCSRLVRQAPMTKRSSKVITTGSTPGGICLDRGARLRNSDLPCDRRSQKADRNRCFWLKPWSVSLAAFVSNHPDRGRRGRHEALITARACPALIGVSPTAS